MTTGNRLVSLSMVLLLVEVLPAFAQDPKPFAAQETTLNILYTGRLFGYFRFPPMQSGKPRSSDFPCQIPMQGGTPESEGLLSSFGQHLWNSVKPYEYSNRILVGTGDNFSLYLPSRIFEPPPDQGPDENQYSKEQFVWNWTHPEWIPDTEHSIDDLLRKGLEVIPTDNVGCMLAYAGYDAIVPGRHDFYYGPEHLRALARLLASMPNGKDSQGKDLPLHPVQMLATNLLINTSWANGHSAIPDNLKPLLPFDPDSKATPKIDFPKDGQEVLPWLSHIELARDDAGKKGSTGGPSIPIQRRAILLGPDENPDQKDWSTSVVNKVLKSVVNKVLKVDVSGAKGCWASDPPENQLIDVIGSCARLREIEGQAKGSAPAAPAPANDDTQGVQGCDKQDCLALTPIKPLPPGYYKLCVWDYAGDVATSKKGMQSLRPVCNRFTVATPFFQFPGGQVQLPPATPLSPHQSDPQPFVVKTVCVEGLPPNCAAQTVAIFGVVNPNLEQQVGGLNSTWLTTKGPKTLRQYRTSIKIADPAKSLTQLMDYLADCENRSLASPDDECYKGLPRAADKGSADVKILLAQMNPSEARQLAAKLKQQYHFDVVVSDQDPDLFTRDQLSIVDPSLSPEAKHSSGADCTSRDNPHPSCNVPSFVAIPPPAWGEPFEMDPARLLQVTPLADNRWEYLVGSAKASRGKVNSALNHDIAHQVTALLPSPPHKKEKKEVVPDGNSAQALQGTTSGPGGNSLQGFDKLRTNAELAFKGRIPSEISQKEGKLDKEREALEKLDSELNTLKSQKSTTQSEMDNLKKKEKDYQEKKKEHDDGVTALAEEAFQEATLFTLLEQTHADVALMEKQDFYFKDPVDCLVELLVDSPLDRRCDKRVMDAIGSKPADLWQKLLSTILWKGDILTVLPVRGSVLQAVMTHSKQYDADDALALAIGNDYNRGLVTLGLKQDPGQGGYSVNDLALDPNRVYTVATTDYIALGDTGYPELNDSTLKALPQPLYAKEPLTYISGAVCRRTSQKNELALCGSTFKAEDYFDALSLQPPIVPPQPGTTWKEQIKQWSSWQSVRTKKQTPPDPEAKKPSTPALEERAQELPKWEWALTKGSVGFTVQRHSETQAELANDFGGVSSVAATAPRAHSWNIDEEMSFTRSAKWGDFLASQQLLYTGSFVDTSSSRNPNQSVDMFGMTLGPRFNLFPQERKRPHLALDTDFHFETQPVNILESLKVKSGSVPLQFYLPRTDNVVARVGPGWYNTKSYFQMGVEGGREFGAFREFDFTNPGSSLISCVPSATQSLQTCVQSNAAITPATGHHVLQETRPVAGYFWHNLLVVPAGSRITTSLENQGELFFNFAGDNTTQTRVQHLLVGKMSFQIWPSLSFSPTYQLFLYENKVQNKFLRQQAAMITLNYQFSLTNKGIAGTQFRYKSAQGQ